MMNSEEQEEIYVGYLPKAPRGIGAVTRRAAIVLLAIAVVTAIVLVFGQQRFALSYFESHYLRVRETVAVGGEQRTVTRSFEYGNVREFEGVVREWPNPALVVGQLSYALVAEGKHGARAMVEGLDGKTVKLRGTLIHRGATEMIEIAAGAVQAISQNVVSAPSSEDLGRQTLVGEIVDSKCYLGVMNPGHTKPHRECASLCIRGGIPPLFVIKDADGREVHLWLVSETGEPVNQHVLDFVAESIEITGQIKRSGDQLYLYANPQSFRR